MGNQGEAMKGPLFVLLALAIAGDGIAKPPPKAVTNAVPSTLRRPPKRVTPLPPVKSFTLFFNTDEASYINVYLNDAFYMTMIPKVEQTRRGVIANWLVMSF